MNQFRENAEGAMRYKELSAKIGAVVMDLANALRSSNIELACHAIRTNRNLLLKLSELTGINLETASLKKIVEEAEQCGAASKFSGAGGGDCAIAVFERGKCNKQILIQRWRDAGFFPLLDCVVFNKVSC